MSRTITEVPLKTNNVDQVLNIISAKMKASGYQEKIVDDETVWAKGDGVMIKMQCLSAVFTGTTLIISKKPGNTGISRDIRTEFTTDLLLSD